MIRENGGWDDFKCIIIKEYPCNNKTELLIEEDRIMMEMKASLNDLRPYKSIEERLLYKSEKAKRYRDKNKEKICAKDKLYRDKNKEKIKETNKQYRDKIKNSIS